MSTHDHPGGDEPTDLAAEYALGVLDNGELRDAERRFASEPGFARDVEDWQARLAGLTDEIAPVSPPAHLWERILRSLEGVANVVEFRLRRSLLMWRGATAVAASLAAVLAVALVWPRPAPTPAPLLTAKLASDHGPTVFVAMFDPTRQQIVLAPASVVASPDRSPELWLIPAGGKPIALGVAEFERVVRLSPNVALTGSGAVLAVSIEPKGGSPTGQPTGPVVATGKLETL